MSKKLTILTMGILILGNATEGMASMGKPPMKREPAAIKVEDHSTMVLAPGGETTMEDGSSITMGSHACIDNYRDIKGKDVHLRVTRKHYESGSSVVISHPFYLKRQKPKAYAIVYKPSLTGEDGEDIYYAATGKSDIPEQMKRDAERQGVLIRRQPADLRMSFDSIEQRQDEGDFSEIVALLISSAKPGEEARPCDIPLTNDDGTYVVTPSIANAVTPFTGEEKRLVSHNLTLRGRGKIILAGNQTQLTEGKTTLEGPVTVACFNTDSIPLNPIIIERKAVLELSGNDAAPSHARSPITVQKGGMLKTLPGSYVVIHSDLLIGADDSHSGECHGKPGGKGTPKSHPVIDFFSGLLS
ncbi:MAG: hypothetical protein LBM19_00510 [Holosporales bacterium]|jgi:hypothetical protein|nr:hypothetical protein [Holosporales bacterium]